MPRSYVLLLAIAPLLCAATLVERLQPDRFETVPLPQHWMPSTIPARISDHRNYPLPMRQMGEMLVKNFIAVYGLPTAVLKPRTREDTPYLLYKLDDGYAIVVYLASLEGDRWIAAALLRPDGETEGPLLK
jgi:hypothetical protein